MDILAAGGRYDGLVRALTEEAGVGEGGEMGDQAGPPSATGVSLAVEKLVGLVAKCPDWQPVRGGVLVGGDRTAAARVAGKLWQAGVTARLECGEVAAGGEDRELLAVTLHCDTTALLSQLDPTTGRTTERKLEVKGAKLFNLLPRRLRDHTGNLDSFLSQLDTFLLALPDTPACGLRECVDDSNSLLMILKKKQIHREETKNK